MDKQTRTITIDNSLLWVFPLLSFLIPFVLPHQQLVVGVIINCLLFLSAKKISNKYVLPVIFLPSIATLSRGLIFGNLTVFLIYFLPFIWLGNYILIFIYKKKGFILASVCKFLLLYLAANLYFSFHLVPKIFLQSMGLLQLITALMGGILAIFISSLA